MIIKFTENEGVVDFFLEGEGVTMETKFDKMASLPYVTAFLTEEPKKSTTIRVPVEAIYSVITLSICEHVLPEIVLNILRHNANMIRNSFITSIGDQL